MLRRIKNGLDAGETAVLHQGGNGRLTHEEELVLHMRGGVTASPDTPIGGGPTPDMPVSIAEGIRGLEAQILHDLRRPRPRRP